MQRKLTPTTNIVIYPMTVDIHQFALPIGVLPGGDALRRRTHYITTNASSVRDYAPGDSFSRIHWPSTARRDRLIVKEFELDPMADIWIVVDMAAFSHFESGRQQEEIEPPQPGEIPVWLRWGEEKYQLPDSTEEYSVTVAASLAQYFLRRDRAVGLLAYGQTHELVQPDRGERQTNRILETLAVLRAEGQVAIEDVINAESKVFPRGTTVIVISPTTREQWATSARELTRTGLRVVTILIDPGSFGGQASAAGLAGLLQAANLITYIVSCGDDLSSSLSSARIAGGYFSVV